MNRFKEGDKVRLVRGPILHKGVFVLPSAVLTVQKANVSASEATYDVLYFDKEMLSHVLTLKESELQPLADTPT